MSQKGDTGALDRFVKLKAMLEDQKRNTGSKIVQEPIDILTDKEEGPIVDATLVESNNRNRNVNTLDKFIKLKSTLETQKRGTSSKVSPQSWSYLDAIFKGTEKQSVIEEAPSYRRGDANSKRRSELNDTSKGSEKRSAVEEAPSITSSSRKGDARSKGWGELSGIFKDIDKSPVIKEEPPFKSGSKKSGAGWKKLGDILKEIEQAPVEESPSTLKPSSQSEDPDFVDVSELEDILKEIEQAPVEESLSTLKSSSQSEDADFADVSELENILKEIEQAPVEESPSALKSSNQSEDAGFADVSELKNILKEIEQAPVEESSSTLKSSSKNEAPDFADVSEFEDILKEIEQAPVEESFPDPESPKLHRGKDNTVRSKFKKVEQDPTIEEVSDSLPIADDTSLARLSRKVKKKSKSGAKAFEEPAEVAVSEAGNVNEDSIVEKISVSPTKAGDLLLRGERNLSIEEEQYLPKKPKSKLMIGGVAVAIIGVIAAIFIFFNQGKTGNIDYETPVFSSAIQENSRDQAYDVVKVDDKIYVVDAVNRKINVYDSKHKLVSSFGEQGTEEGQFVTITSITADQDGNLYIGDMGMKRISVFDQTGNFKEVLDLSSLELQGVIATRIVEDKLYFSDTMSSRAFVLDLNGKLLLEIEGKIDGKNLSLPYGLTASDEHIYVADSGNNRILKLDKKGNHVSTITDELLTLPRMLSFNDGILYAIEHEKGLLLGFDQADKLSFAVPDDEAVDENEKLSKPIGLYVEGHDIYVANLESNKVSVFKR